MQAPIGQAGKAPPPRAWRPMRAPRTGGAGSRAAAELFPTPRPVLQSPERPTCDARVFPSPLPRAMSRREAAANASSSGVAPRRSSTGSRGAERTATEEPSRRGRVGSRGAGSGWREPAGPAEATAAGRREPPLCFGVKNDVVGAVIGERGPGWGGGGGGGRRGAQIWGGRSGVRERTFGKARAGSAAKPGAGERTFPLFPPRGSCAVPSTCSCQSVLWSPEVRASALSLPWFNFEVDLTAGERYMEGLKVQASALRRCVYSDGDVSLRRSTTGVNS